MPMLNQRRKTKRAHECETDSESFADLSWPDLRKLAKARGISTHQRTRADVEKALAQ